MHDAVPPPGCLASRESTRIRASARRDHLRRRLPADDPNRRSAPQATLPGYMLTAVVLLSLLSSGITLAVILVGLVEERAWLARSPRAVSSGEFDRPPLIQQIHVRHRSGG